MTYIRNPGPLFLRIGFIPVDDKPPAPVPLPVPVFPGAVESLIEDPAPTPPRSVSAPAALVIPPAPEAPAVQALPRAPSAPTTESPFPVPPTPPLVPARQPVHLVPLPPVVAPPVTNQQEGPPIAPTDPADDIPFVCERKGRPALAPGLPDVPAGHPCYVTQQEAANGNPATDRRGWEDLLAQALGVVLSSKPRRLLKTLADEPRLYEAAVRTMSSGIWNVVDVDYGTIRYEGPTLSTPSGRPLASGSVRKSQGYGLIVLSEKWVLGLHSQARFLIGEAAASRLGPISPSVRLGAPYAIGPNLVDKASAPYWVWLYIAAMDAHLAADLDFSSAAAFPKTQTYKLAHQAASKVGPGIAVGGWLQAWLRYGSAQGASAGLINGEVPLGEYKRNFYGVEAPV